MITKPRKKRGSWLLTAPLVAAALAYLFLIFLPGMQKIREIRASVTLQQEFVTQALKMAPVIGAMEQELAVAKKFNESFFAQAPRSGELSALYGRIDEIGEKASVETARFEPQPAVHLDLLERVPVVLENSGSFSELIAFLRGLEQLKAPIWVSELKLEGPSETGKDVQAEIKMDVFAVESNNSN